MMGRTARRQSRRPDEKKGAGSMPAPQDWNEMKGSVAPLSTFRVVALPHATEQEQALKLTGVVHAAFIAEAAGALPRALRIAT
jgi:hypothetical protein